MSDIVTAPAPAPAAAPTAPAPAPAAPSSTPQADGDNRAPSEARQASPSAQPTEPEYEGRGSLDKMFQQAELDYKLDTLSEGGEVTIEQLRQLPGAEKYTDAQLQAMWAEVQGQAQPRDAQGRFLPKDQAATQPAAESQPPAQAKPRSWKAYDAQGNEIADVSKLTAEQLLAAQFGYTANGKEQRRAFDELVRNAQLGHFNGERVQQLTTERDTAYQQWKQLEQEATQLREMRQTWMAAIDAASRQNYTPLQTLLDSYVAAMQQQPAPAQQPNVAGPPPEQIAAGAHVYHTQVMPRAQELATQYGLPAEDVAQTIMALVEREPWEFMNPGRFQQIMQHEIVQTIERFVAGRQPAAAPDSRDAELAQLRAQVAQLTQRHNSSIEAMHERLRSAPPAAGTLPAGAGTLETPDLEGAADARKWLRNLR